MEIAQELRQFFAQTREMSPYEFAQNVDAVLQRIVGEGGECDAGGTDRMRAIGENSYGEVAKFLVQHELHAAAALTLQRWWNELGQRQHRSGRHFVRAMAGQWLSTVHLAAGNRGTAYRWSLLTHADDILGRHVQGGGGALDRLHTQFGMSAEALRALTQLAEQCRDDAEDKPDGWTRPSGFPEEVARRFAEANPAYAQQISSLEASDQFPLAQPYLVALLDEVERTQPNTKEQGDRLEELASYLFSLLPGCVPQRTTDDEDDAFESDVIVRNLYHAPNLLSDLFGRHILVECKNWERTVSVEPVGYFLFRMRITHARLGVIIAKRNITGDEKSERNARALIRRSYHEDGSICIVLDRNDIRSLIDKDVGFLALLLERAERLRFGKRRQSTSGR